ncbi:hypothetical protein AV530_012597 [Patagioenas fasciata monilis]|uniref:Uncharacterized protein n=1 Tax=Patagioenas fasciata monilis TaxID=372326 RepID=A0A1V4JBM1_PATFA|nr:hypothetical protein AV530_012597 [Patagioenas fasciata monilis]
MESLCTELLCGSKKGQQDSRGKPLHKADGENPVKQRGKDKERKMILPHPLPRTLEIHKSTRKNYIHTSLCS